MFKKRSLKKKTLKFRSRRRRIKKRKRDPAAVAAVAVSAVVVVDAVRVEAWTSKLLALLATETWLRYVDRLAAIDRYLAPFNCAWTACCVGVFVHLLLRNDRLRTVIEAVDPTGNLDLVATVPIEVVKGCGSSSVRTVSEFFTGYLNAVGLLFDGNDEEGTTTTTTTTTGIRHAIRTGKPWFVTQLQPGANVVSFHIPGLAITTLHHSFVFVGADGETVVTNSWAAEYSATCRHVRPVSVAARKFSSRQVQAALDTINMEFLTVGDGADGGGAGEEEEDEEDREINRTLRTNKVVCMTTIFEGFASPAEIVESYMYCRAVVLRTEILDEAVAAGFGNCNRLMYGAS